MFLVVKKWKVIVGILLVAAIITGGVLIADGTAKAAESKKLLPTYGVDTEENIVGLTFDAAWGSDKTMDILDILDRYEVKATFFLVGFWIDKNPELAVEIHNRGHLIGNHSTNHPHFNTLSENDMALEVDSTSEKIMAITGNQKLYFRAPYGEYNDTLIRLIDERGGVTVQWTEDSLDWKGLSGGQIADRVLKTVKKGSVILCHNNSDHITEALPILLLGLKNMGLTPVRLDELIPEGEYYIDNNGIRHSVEQ